MDEIIKIIKRPEIRLVGSHARNEDDPGDIDYVTTLKASELNRYLASKFDHVQLMLGGQIYRKYTIDGVLVDFWYTSPRRFNYLTIYRTIPKEQLIGLKILAKSYGYHLTSIGLHDPEKNRYIINWNDIRKALEIKSPTLIQFFKLKFT